MISPNCNSVVFTLVAIIIRELGDVVRLIRINFERHCRGATRDSVKGSALSSSVQNDGDVAKQVRGQRTARIIGLRR